VSDRIEVSTTAVEQITERFPLVLANIEARVLVPLAQVLSERVAPSGKLFLSGLLQPDMERMLTAYEHLKVLAIEEAGDWRALLLERH
jgi:ribosomal protein L11 methyltransferase